MVATDFVGNACYKLSWPKDLFVEEVGLPWERGVEFGIGDEWSSEVELLLRQAFASEIPAEDFRQACSTATQRATPTAEHPGVRWLHELAEAADSEPIGPKPYSSQPKSDVPKELEGSLPLMLAQVCSLLQELYRDDFLAQVLGCESFELPTELVEKELELLLEKPSSWSAPPEAFTEPDLYDIIEAFDDLAVRPTKVVYQYEGGYHPQEFSQRSGKALYRRRMNQLLDTTTLRYRIAETGDDAGRVVLAVPDELGRLTREVLSEQTPDQDDKSHAIALFRDRNASRAQRRSAVVALARILEDRRSLLKQHLSKKDEGALFEIANRFDLRHNKENQLKDYDEKFLEWIFYWYLATVQLTDRLLADQQG